MNVTLNPLAAFRNYAGKVVASHIPAGRWTVRTALVGDVAVAYAARQDDESATFTIAEGPDADVIWLAAEQWASSASVGMPMDRIKFRGGPGGPGTSLTDALLAVA